MPLIVTDQYGNPFSLTIAADGSLQTVPAPGVSPSTNNGVIAFKALDLISSALRLIGVQASGEQANITEANDSLMVLQQMIDAWNAESLNVFTSRIDDYALVSGQQKYAYGPGGDFNADRPASIDSMSTILIDNPSNPIEVPITMYTVDQWQNLSVKAVNGGFPTTCYDDGGFPLRMLSMWPIPAQPCVARIYSRQSLVWPATLATTLSFPPGYAEAFRYNLAVRLAPEFGAQLPPAVAAIAVDSLARVRSSNPPDLRLKSDLCGTDGYNYRSDMFGMA